MSGSPTFRLFGHDFHRTAVRDGAVVALAVTVPAALALSFAIDEDSAWNAPALLLAGSGFIAGGAVAGLRARGSAASHGAVAGLVAVTALVAVRIVRRIAGGDDIQWMSLAATVVVGTWLAALGGAVAGVVARRRADVGAEPLHRPSGR